MFQLGKIDFYKFCKKAILKNRYHMCSSKVRICSSCSGPKLNIEKISAPAWPARTGLCRQHEAFYVAQRIFRVTDFYKSLAMSPVPARNPLSNPRYLCILIHLVVYPQSIATPLSRPCNHVASADIASSSVAKSTTPSVSTPIPRSRLRRELIAASLGYVEGPCPQCLMLRFVDIRNTALRREFLAVAPRAKLDLAPGWPHSSPGAPKSIPDLSGTSLPGTFPEPPQADPRPTPNQPKTEPKPRFSHPKPPLALGFVALLDLT